MGSSAKLRRSSITVYGEPTDKIDYEHLSTSQRKAVDVVRENLKLYERTGATLKHGVIIYAAWGSGKSQGILTMKKMQLIDDVLELGDPYKQVTKDIELKEEETLQKIANNIVKRASKLKKPFIALDNPDVPAGSRVTEKGAFNFIKWLLEEAVSGRMELPYLVVTLNEFTYRRLAEEQVRMAKIVQHFDVVKLEWSSQDLEKAVRARLPSDVLRGGDETLKTITSIARTPRAAIYIYLKWLSRTEGRGVSRDALLNFVINEGIKPALDTYIEILAQPGYKLSRVKSKKWIDVWRSIVSRDEHRKLVIRLIERAGVTSSELRKALSSPYKVKHWPITAAMKYHIVERPEPATYRFTDEFLAASVEYSAGSSESAREVLRNMAELYGRTGIRH